MKRPKKKEAFFQLRALTGSDILQRIQQAEHPGRLVRELPLEDFYWVVKKVGRQDAALLLKMASERQWQYLLDLELWHGDRLDVAQSGTWLGRLAQADCSRLARWLFSEGEYFAYYHLFRSVEVIAIEDDEERWDLPDGFFTVDGVYYIRTLDPEQRETLESLLEVMSQEDYTRFQALLLGLQGVLPADLEEELYRLRNVRLAERGFLPYEEAISVYAPLDPSRLQSETPAMLTGADSRTGNGGEDWIPVIPLEHAESGNLFMEAVSASPNSLLVDRIRLEFAGLCNQILSADRSLSPDLSTLEDVCRKASSYVNLGLERLCGKDPPGVEQVLERHDLVSLFRVGFGLAMKVQWEAKRWLNRSWFLPQGLDYDFWGDYWGGILTGVLEHRPRFYVGRHRGPEFRDFEWLSDLAECLKVVRRLMVLDSLLARLTSTYPFDLDFLPLESPTFRPLLFNLWARRLLRIETSFAPLSVDQAERFLERLRTQGGEVDPPYTMPGLGERFVNDFLEVASESDPEVAAILKEALVLIWQEFKQEYEWVSAQDLDERYVKFITIREPRSLVH